MAFFATCLVTFWKCCCYYGEPGNTFGAPPPQGGSSYGDSEKKVSFESIVLSREACGPSSPGSPPSTAGRPKGQLISKCTFGGFKSSKKPTKFFPGFLPLPLNRGQNKILQLMHTS